jgi:hypothetical protein
VLAAITLLLAAPAEGRYKGITQIRFANAYCESGGDIHAIGWHGIYRGKWQFDRSTWRSYAPRRWKHADPAWVPEWVQDLAALAVPYDAWPNC